MTDIAWEKPRQPAAPSRKINAERLKLYAGLALIAAVLVFVIVNGTVNNARYFISISALLEDPTFVGKTVRVSGAVVGSSIAYDAENLIIDFTVADFDESTTDLVSALHEAVVNPNTARIQVHVENMVKPDLLIDEAQAIMTGTLDADGTFYATEVLLKCPSRYEEAVPEQAVVSDEFSAAHP
ncbi:MAG: cytochrome c maturation protein CcmE [Anaerolineae bacterium]|nr:cytochrome c maturation protein CcmE [Anaerolineae bacterium]